MNSIFEEIWATSLADMCMARDGEDERVLDVLEEHEKVLKDALEHSMEEVMDEYSFAQNERAAIYGKQCFFAGVRFATKYLLEVMYG